VEVFKDTGKLNEEEIALVCNLMGYSPMVKKGIVENGFTSEDVPVLEGEIARLEERRDEVLHPMNEAERTAAILGVPINELKPIRLLRRYEHENWNKYLRLCRELGVKVQPRNLESNEMCPDPTPPHAKPPQEAPTPEPEAPDGPTYRDRTIRSEGADDELRDEAGVTSPGLDGSRGLEDRSPTSGPDPDDDATISDR
jgi:hypothetical protein